MELIMFDPGVGSSNLGDQVIGDSVMRELISLFPEANVRRLSLFQPMGESQRRTLRAAKLALVAGSNMLSATFKFPTYRNRWKIALLDLAMLPPVVTVGAGWYRKDFESNALGRAVLRRVAAKDVPMSVRDAVTKENLARIGVAAVNTSCATLWSVDPSVYEAGQPCRDVVTTITDYGMSATRDAAMLRALVGKYRKVYFWPQGEKDLQYLATLGVGGLDILPRSLEAYDQLLMSGGVEYIGTRLHGAIRALQKGVRAKIVSVDYRADNICEEVGIPCFRSNQTPEQMPAFMESGWDGAIHLPRADIETWRQKLRDAVGA